LAREAAATVARFVRAVDVGDFCDAIHETSESLQNLRARVAKNTPGGPHSTFVNAQTAELDAC